MPKAVALKPMASQALGGGASGVASRWSSGAGGAVTAAFESSTIEAVVGVSSMPMNANKLARCVPGPAHALVMTQQSCDVVP